MKLIREDFIRDNYVKVYSNESGTEIYVYDLTGIPCAALFIGKAAKPTDNYRFGTVALRDAYIKQTIEEEQKRLAYKQQRKEELATKKAAFVNPFVVGDVLTYSWGYDQTNVEAFQVVGVTKASVKLRRIAITEVRATGSMSSMVKPVPGKFLDEKVSTHRVTVDGYISMAFGIAQKWSGRELYQSWYA